MLLALPAAAHAQQGLKLKPQSLILDLPDDKTGGPSPIYLEADRLQGLTERITEASGNARARSRGHGFTADWMQFDHANNELTALGNVRMEKGPYTMQGTRLRYDLDTERGIFETVSYALNPRGTGYLPIAGAAAPTFDGHGKAQRIFIEGEGQFRAQQASFTTCEPGNTRWNLHANDLRIYQEQGLGVAGNATFEFEGLKVFYTPYFSFPLHQERKSGFLTPHYGSSNTSGFEFSIPYFFNLAPNYDLTLTPRVITRRGVQLRSDFRYLQPSYKGEFAHEILPGDRAINRTRQLLALKHSHSLWGGWSGMLDLNKVSDDKYFTDLSTRVTLTSQTFLQRTGTLARGGTWGNSGIYSLNVLMQGWQTLQTDPNAPLTPPYSRRPQINFAASDSDVLRGEFNLQSHFAEFDHPTLVRGKRIMAYPSWSLPWQRAGVYFTPKIGLHMTRYSLGANNTLNLPDATRVVPIATASAGLIFERDANIFGNAYLQTLEPKAYYVYIPFHDQRRMPNFDSALMDINFGTIYSENQFSGNDRINDAHQITLGAMSRLINPGNGVEILRAGLAQRFYFRSPRVTTQPNEAPPGTTSTRSDILALLSGGIAPYTTVDLGAQMNTETGQIVRSNATVRYQPQLGKSLNFTYRQNVPSKIRQVDLSGQWPIARGWRAIGRWNFSLQDRRTLEGVAGLEYDGDCYVLRMVAHRVSITTTSANTAFFVELELNGFGRVGSDALNLLRRSVSGYTRDDRNAGRAFEYNVPER